MRGVFVFGASSESFRHPRLRTSRDYNIRLGSLSLVDGTGLVTSVFSGTVGAGAAPRGTGLFNQYSKQLVQDMI